MSAAETLMCGLKYETANSAHGDEIGELVGRRLDAEINLGLRFMWISGKVISGFWYILCIQPFPVTAGVIYTKTEDTLNLFHQKVYLVTVGNM